MYPAIVTFVATAPIALHRPWTSTYPRSLEILVLIVLLVAIAAAAHYIGRLWFSRKT
jgi:hypothetical protein